MRSFRIRRASVALAVLSFVLPLAACSGDGEPSPAASAPAASPNPATSASADGFPVTLEQTAGNVTIPARPSRVVALDVPSADAAIALGVIPVGMPGFPSAEGGVAEWTADALGNNPPPELFNQDNGFPFEKLAQLDPDVLLATNTYPLVTESWSRLNEIAPVVAHTVSPGVDDWQDGMRKVARALGRTARSERLIAETEAALQRVRDGHPEFDGATASFINYIPGDGLYVITSNEDVSMRFLRDLGFAGAPAAVTALGGGAVGADRTILRPEQYPVLDADVILGTTSDPDLSALDDLVESEAFARVPAVDRGSFLGFGVRRATAMAFPSVLSVQWVLREIVEDLADAVRLSEDAAAPPAG